VCLCVSLFSLLFVALLSLLSLSLLSFSPLFLSFLSLSRFPAYFYLIKRERDKRIATRSPTFVANLL